MPALIRVYRKPGCSLCDDAIDRLDEVSGDFDFTVEPVNVLEDDALFAKYRYRVPVVVIDGIESLELRFEEKDLVQALERAQVPRRE